MVSRGEGALQAGDKRSHVIVVIEVRVVRHRAYPHEFMGKLSALRGIQIELHEVIADTEECRINPERGAIRVAGVRIALPVQSLDPFEEEFHRNRFVALPAFEGHAYPFPYETFREAAAPTLQYFFEFRKYLVRDGDCGAGLGYARIPPRADH